ncbi:MAG: hypothetical protein II670_14375, partial [Alphaproteobacteria bacterium]|nr:hypothetical protein [Alphaproteobacteria bacterium]
KGKNLSDYRMYVPDCYAYEGMLGSYRPYEPLGYAGKLGTWCNKYDMFCSSYLSASSHTSYVADGLYGDASRVIAAKIAESFDVEERYTSPHDTVILIDSTGSMNSLIDKYKTEAKRLANKTWEAGGRVALYDYRDLADPYNVVKHCDFETSSVDWAKLAAGAIQETIGSGKIPIIVGGTGLYVKTLIEGVSPMPIISAKNRQKAEELSVYDFSAMCEELYSFDPNLRHMLPQSMHHQLIRAYEIFLETGKSIRYFWSLPKMQFIQNVDFEIEVIHCERTILYERIAHRFEQMLYNGAIDEVRNLLSKITIKTHKEIFMTFPIFKAIGAKEITMFLNGIYTFEQMKETSIKNSRHYAKRQITWFKHQIKHCRR